MNVREKLYEVIQETASSDKELNDAVLVGFMVIAEWSAPNGDPWLSKVSGDHSKGLPGWRQRGYAAEVLHDFWADHSDEEESAE